MFATWSRSVPPRARLGAKFDLGNADPDTIAAYKALNAYVNADPGSAAERRAWRNYARLTTKTNPQAVQAPSAPAATTAPTPPNTSSSPQGAIGSFALKDGYRDWNATITSLTGADTPNARMTGAVTRGDVEEFCQRTNGDDYGGSPSACVSQVMKIEANTARSATADCVERTLVAEWGETYRLSHVGTDGSTDWTTPAGEPVDDCAQCGTDALRLEMMALCPSLFPR